MAGKDITICCVATFRWGARVERFAHLSTVAQELIPLV